jgi:predicted dehydrogenase
MSVSIGLIGCGEHSEIGHAVPLARYSAEKPGAVTLAAACDLRRDRADLFCQKYGFARPYVDMGDMLSGEKLDVAIAVTPVEVIPQVGMQLLEAKIPCVVEKPLGPSLGQVQALLEASRATKTPNMVSVNRRFMPLLIRGMEWARNAGTLRYVRATMLRHERIEPEFLRFTAIHALDTVRFIAGDFASCNIRTLSPAIPRWYVIDFRSASGVLGRVDVLPTAGMVEETYELMGDGFRAIITSPFGPQKVLRCYQQNRIVREEIADKPTPEDVIFGFYGETSELIDAITHGRPPRPSIEDIFPSVQACFDLADRAENKASPTRV